MVIRVNTDDYFFNFVAFASGWPAKFYGAMLNEICKENFVTNFYFMYMYYTCTCTCTAPLYMYSTYIPIMNSWE